MEHVKAQTYWRVNYPGNKKACCSDKDTRKVIKNLEAVINHICENIKEKKAESGVNKLDSMPKLVNSYSRLIEQDKQKETDPTMDGDQTYYKRLTAKITDMKGVIR